jgi:hypothetical protein
LEQATDFPESLSRKYYPSMSVERCLAETALLAPLKEFLLRIGRPIAEFV